MNEDMLAVWHGIRRVGRLRRRSDRRMEFRYDSEWIRERGFPISHSMPLNSRDSTARGERAHRFFANLLPEGGARDRAVRHLRVPDDDFELLRRLGNECAGALRIRPEGQEPDSTDKEAYRLVNDGMLGRLISSRGWDFQEPDSNRLLRQSLAGAQDKMTVAHHNSLIFVPVGTVPASHILKFDSAAHPDLPAIECFATLLADSVGLGAVKFELRRVGRDLIGLIERYDRMRVKDGRIQRLHQEDFCQALGYSSRTKYESDGGPSFARCYRLVRDISDSPLEDLERLLRWQIFNVLVGNSNGHAKNLSLLYGSDGGTRLAPFYDLVPTRAIENLDQRLALKVGGVDDPVHVTRGNWESLAVECGVRPSVVISLARQTAESLMASLRHKREQFEETHGPFPALQRVERIVRDQCDGVLRRH